MSIDVRVSTIGAPSVLIAGDIWSLLCELDKDLDKLENEHGRECIRENGGSNIYPIKQGQGGRCVGSGTGTFLDEVGC